jgi:hypothetical protein
LFSFSTAQLAGLDILAGGEASEAFGVLFISCQECFYVGILV